MASCRNGARSFRSRMRSAAPRRCRCSSRRCSLARRPKMLASSFFTCACTVRAWSGTELLRHA
eukprot:6189119-Pleurochrysis_carterae.AAC.1